MQMQYLAPNVNFYRNSGSPADNDHLGEIRFTGRNDNSEDVVYANIETRIKDASDGTEDGYFDFETMVAGTLQSRLIMNETTTVFNEDSLDLDFRVESNGDANMLFVDAGNDRVELELPHLDHLLHASGSGDAVIAATGGASSIAGLNLGNSTNKADGGIRYDNSSDDLIFRAENAEKMRIASNNLLVGKTSSTGVATGNIEVSNASSASVQIEGGTNEWSMLVSSSADALRFYQDSAEKMRLNSSGQLGIGTSSPGVILHTSTSSDNVGRFESTDATAYIQINDTADSFYLATGTQIGSIGGNASVNGNNLNIDLTNGRVGIGTTSPNRKLHCYESTSSTSNFIQMTTVSTGETGSNGLLVGISAAGQAEIWNYEAQPTVFATNGSERMRILSDGCNYWWYFFRSKWSFKY